MFRTIDRQLVFIFKSWLTIFELITVRITVLSNFHCRSPFVGRLSVTLFIFQSQVLPALESCALEKFCKELRVFLSLCRSLALLENRYLSVAMNDCTPTIILILEKTCEKSDRRRCDVLTDSKSYRRLYYYFSLGSRDWSSMPARIPPSLTTIKVQNNCNVEIGCLSSF